MPDLSGRSPAPGPRGRRDARRSGPEEAGPPDAPLDPAALDEAVRRQLRFLDWARELLALGLEITPLPEAVVASIRSEYHLVCAERAKAGVSEPFRAP